MVAVVAALAVAQHVEHRVEAHLAYLAARLEVVAVVFAAVLPATPAAFA